MNWEQAWLKYEQDETGTYASFLSSITLKGHSEVLDTAVKELQLAAAAMYGIIPHVNESEKIPHEGIHLVVGDNDMAIGTEGYKIESYGGLITVYGESDVGVLYGVFGVLRLMRSGGIPDGYQGVEIPDNPLRMLNHWDNMDGSIERGYSGESFFFKSGEVIVSERIMDYTRLNASIGINGVVINNVNVAGAAIDLITEKYREPLKTYSDIFRAHGIKLYLSLDYAAPMDIGGLDTCDPLDEQVITWWQRTLDALYSELPDMGGFLIKADSEGRPGPFSYGRTHAEGANMLGKIVAPYGGIILWRCFVYNCTQDWRDTTQDRASASYDHFIPLDGAFDDNVILQIKNGPMDFQVREPVSPLLGAMKATNQVLEFQAAQEYTGQQRHVCYLVPMWKEVLDFRTHCASENDRVRDVVAGRTYAMKHSGIAAVANTGNDSNWTGHDLAAANYYGFGRLIWKTSLTSEEIAEEWVCQTFNREAVDVICNMLMKSWPAYEKYTSPLGIGWMVNPGHHYGPNVDGYEYDMFGTYHRADHLAMGVDRTEAGTGYIDQYFPKNKRMYSSTVTCPESLLLFFHRIPYSYQLSTGKTLIQHIYDAHYEGVETVSEMLEQWTALEGTVEALPYMRVKKRLEHQLDHAGLWRDVVNSYFYRKTLIEDEKGRKLY
ncbi:alpha-glucuronidase [Vallitalea pronyensis]|uniref:Xylan alpha-1,2-glucuronidase n=1 Tax=Vallitalea pronyensis TaxID=1348613 RepID=A0A8J8MQ62_9FIRM|nr:alpha-glucuronidase family glycosyl hydrolase [Vallitalea pronyensis]QUI25388.1 alpha-glucuronidase [Vallitalea pronyensis]